MKRLRGFIAILLILGLSFGLAVTGFAAPRICVECGAKVEYEDSIWLSVESVYGVPSIPGLGSHLFAESGGYTDGNHCPSCTDKIAQAYLATLSRLNVTVPAVLPITVSADGAVVTATDAKITNNGTNAVSVSSLKVTPAVGWSIVSESEAVAAAPGANVMALSFQGQSCAADGTVDTTAWSEIAGGTSMGMTYAAKIPSATQPSAGSAASAVIVLKEQPSTPTTTLLSDMPEGSVVYLNESGSPVEFYVAKQNYEPELNGLGRTLLVRKLCYSYGNGNTGMITTNEYSGNDIDTMLNSSYIALFEQDVQNAIGSTKFRYTPRLSSAVSMLNRSVFILSLTELGKSATNANVEGSALPIAHVLQYGTILSNARMFESPCSQWTRTRVTTDNSSSYSLYSNGTPQSNTVNVNYGIRPAFTLPETCLVDETGMVVPPEPEPTLLGELEVGSSVYLNVDGAPTEFLVVNQGNPDPNIYDASCNGTWLLMKDCYVGKQWHSSDVNDYANSDIHNYLNSTFLNLLDRDVQASIKQIKIPYRTNESSGGTDHLGADGLTTKVFLLSGYEVGLNSSVISILNKDGAKLDYFISGNDAAAQQRRIATLNGVQEKWWTRTIGNTNTTAALFVFDDGGWSFGPGGVSVWSHGIRPALVLPADLQVAPDGSVIAPISTIALSFDPETGTIGGYEVIETLKAS